MIRHNFQIDKTEEGLESGLDDIVEKIAKFAESIGENDLAVATILLPDGEEQVCQAAFNTPAEQLKEAFLKQIEEEKAARAAVKPQPADDGIVVSEVAPVEAVVDEVSPEMENAVEDAAKSEPKKGKKKAE